MTDDGRTWLTLSTALQDQIFSSPEEALKVYGSWVIKELKYPPPMLTVPLKPPPVTQSYTEVRYRLTAFYDPLKDCYFWKYIKDN